MAEHNTIFVTAANSAVSTFNAGGRSGTYETVFDLQTPTGVVFLLKPGRQMADRDALRVRMSLRDSTNTLLADDATVQFIGQEATEEDETQIGTVRQLRHFNNADQYNEDEVFRLDIEQVYRFTEDAHFKMKLDSATAVDWTASGTYIEVEVIRQS